MAAKKEVEQKWLDQITPQIVAEVHAAADEKNRLSCEIARKLADTLGVPKPVIGATATQESIRIVNCGLGCF